MNRNISIQIKAGVLFIVFSMNIVIGFACAIGLDMGFNHKHHEEEKETRSCCHDEARDDHPKSNNDQDNCCNQIVVKLAQVDRLFAQSSSFNANAWFFNTNGFSHYDIGALIVNQVNGSIRYFVRNHHPPISNILTLIQRFQI